MLKDLIQKLIIVLSLEYLIFFGAEVILPGVITSTFNINILLVSVLVLIIFLIIINNNQNVSSKIAKENKSLNTNSNYTKLFVPLGVLILVFNSIALYKVSIVVIVVYTIIISIIVKLLWKNL